MTDFKDPFEQFDVHSIAKILAVKEQIRNRTKDFHLTFQKVYGKMIPPFNAYFISGGVTASLLQNEEPKDIDIYFSDGIVADKIINLYKTDESYKNEVATFSEKYRDVIGHPSGLMITENAMTLKNGNQLITRNYGTPEEIRKTFDFVHCMPYYSPSTDKFYISAEQYNCCVGKVLKPNGTNIAERFRIDKFVSRGYKIGNT